MRDIYADAPERPPVTITIEPERFFSGKSGRWDVTFWRANFGTTVHMTREEIEAAYVTLGRFLEEQESCDIMRQIAEGEADGPADS